MKEVRGKDAKKKVAAEVVEAEDEEEVPREPMYIEIPPDPS